MLKITIIILKLYLNINKLKVSKITKMIYYKAINTQFCNIFIKCLEKLKITNDLLKFYLPLIVRFGRDTRIRTGKPCGHWFLN